MMFFKLAFKEIKNNYRFSLFFVFNLSLGLSGLSAIDSFKISIRDALNVRSKSILAADIGVGARRPLTLDEESIINSLLPPSTLSTRVFESFTMVSSATNSRLVELKAIEPAYPYYGAIELEKSGLVTSQAAKDLFQLPAVWTYPELLLQLGLQVGDQIQLGSLKFTITDKILGDPSAVGAGFAFAPTVYVARSYFDKTGLIQTGSTGYYSRLIQIPSTGTPSDDAKIEALANHLNEALADPAIQVFTNKNASEQIGRSLRYLADYLGLAGLVAIFLTLLGQSFLYRQYLVKRYKEVAIFKCLGLRSNDILKIYLAQILTLSLLAVGPAVLFSGLLLPLLKAPLYAATNIEISLQLQFSTLVMLFIMAIVGSLAVSAPLLLRALQVRPRELLQPAEALSPWSTRHRIISYLPAATAFYIASIWFTQSWPTGSVFFALFAGALIALTTLSLGLLQLLESVKFKNFALRLASRNLTREKLASTAAILALGLGVLLSSLIPLLQAGIRSEIETPIGLEHPSLFLFDIQEEQLEELKAFLGSSQVKIMQISPMIRSRLKAVNGLPFEKATRASGTISREQENENRFRNRGFNLTYRNELSPAERIVEGDDFKLPRMTQWPQISLETRFAKRLGLQIGDRLIFDVQGVDIEGQVVNLRKVRWTSFQPNFFLQFEEGPLDEAPKTFLGTLGPLELSSKVEIQNALVHQFPNISMIDVSRLIERITTLIEQMSLALRAMAIFSLLVGFIILFSITSQQVYERRQEMNLLKVLGGHFSIIQNIFLIEFLSLSTFSALAGIAISYVISYVLASQFFDSAFVVDLSTSILIFLATVLLSGLLTLIALRTVLKARPMDLLQSP